ncbi:hypothetical protein RDI58_021176 [Solanum bulbocastanum]|uniref:AP2/ERF domain-containing protein n=1 Tax=Solanum bulbocastanum TaxID=147425 RepID=A0AAN8TB55_SOLBU
MDSKKVVVNVKQGKKLESDECNTSKNCNPKDKISLIGIRRQKNGRYAAVITDRIRHKKVWLGTFDTVEEASQAYFSKKSEFENEKLSNQGKKKSKRIRETRSIVEVYKRGKYNSEKSEELLNVKQGNENVNCEVFQIESAGESEIDVVISNSFNGGTEQRIDSHEIGTVEEAFRIAKEGSRVMANVCGTKSSDDCNNTTSCNPKVKVSLIGTRRQKNGRHAAVITDPFTHKRVWLGTFDTVEEASQAYFSKKSEFEKLRQQGNKQNTLKKKNCDQIQQLESSSVVAFLDTTASESGRAKRIDSYKKTTHLIGAHKSTKKGRYQSEIKNPITKKRIWLGTFGSAEEASHAFQSKKLEFQKLVEEKQEQCTYKQLKSEKLVNLKQGQENVKCEPFQPESASGSPDIDIPFSNSSNGGTVQSIDPDKIDNQSKKFDLELESNMNVDLSAGEKQGQEDDEDLWKGEWVQLPGDDRAVMFSLKLGLPIIDNYGSLLGEFSTLDDLSICKTEEGNNYISHSI